MAFKDIFGFSFKKDKQESPQKENEFGGLEPPKSQPSFVTPEDYDGTYVIEGGGFFSQYYDFGGALIQENTQIQQYRSLALYPEVDRAIQDIVNDAIVFDDKYDCIKLDLDNIDNISDNIKTKIHQEFKNIKKLLDFSNKADDIFRRWYIDSKVFFHIIIDTSHPEKGIQQLRSIDPTMIQKVRKVEKEVKNVNHVNLALVKNVEEFYVYTDMDKDSVTPTTTAGIKISVDSICYAHSGIIDSGSKRVVGYLQKAVRPVNMLRQIEDAVVIYRISRAPERRVFYVDVGNLPKQKAEQYISSLMNKYRNKITYDSKTGEIKDERNHMSMLEDYWIPRRDGNRGTEISLLDGGQNLGQMDDVDYLLKKVYRSLNVPISRLETSTGFNMGRQGEITRDEVQFFKFIEKLRKRFSFLLLDLLKKQCLLKGILTQNDWNNLAQDIRFDWNKDSHFNELKENEIMREKVDMLNVMANYTNQFFSAKWVRKHVLKQTDEEINEMNQEIEEEQAKIMQQQILQQQMNPEGKDQSEQM